VELFSLVIVLGFWVLIGALGRYRIKLPPELRKSKYGREGHDLNVDGTRISIGQL